MNNVLVLGGSGFVGGSIVRALAETNDFTPICAARHAPSSAKNIKFCECDASDAESLRYAMRDVNWVVNAMLSPPARMISATRNICKIVGRIGLPKIVHISSTSVYGPASGLLDENAALDGSGGAYMAAKVACEKILEQLIRAGGDAVILRPGIVYGPRGQQWIGRLCRMLRARRLGDLGAAGDGFCNLIHSDDLGRAVIATLRAPHALGQAFNLATPTPPRWNDVFVALGCGIGAVPVPRIGMRRLALEAKFLAYGLHASRQALARIGCKAGAIAEPITPSMLALFAQQVRFDSRKADQMLAFSRIDDLAGLAASAAWFNTVAG